MFAGAAAITDASLVYFEPGVVAPFVIERLPTLHLPALWKAALKLHVASALLSFPLCLLLATRWLQRRALWHRRLGRVTGVLLLFVLVPSGAVLAVQAEGGLGVTLGFLLSGAIVVVATVFGVGAARRRDLATHAYAMRHVLAQMSVAVSSRALIAAFAFAGVHPDTVYGIALWGPVLLSAAIVELVSSPSVLRSFKSLRNPKRSRDDLESFPIVVRTAVAAAFPRRGR